MPKKAVITADIVDSTSLTKEQRLWLNVRTNEMLMLISPLYFFRFEQYRGDSFQCVMPPNKGLRVALLIKTYLKSLQSTIPSNDTQGKGNDHRLDVRLSLAIGEVEMETEKLGTSDGEAFRLSGKRLDEMKKEKRTFCVTTKGTFERELEIEGHLLDVLLSKATPLQCEVIHYKIQERKEQWIATKLQINQPAVNQRSMSLGWNAIEKTIKRFEEIYGS